jgi:hypothetical protein
MAKTDTGGEFLRTDANRHGLSAMIKRFDNHWIAFIYLEVVYLYIADNWSGPAWSCPHRVTKAVTGSHMGGPGPD